MSFGTPSPIAINAANVTLSGVNSVFSEINSLAENNGTFSVLAGRNFTTAAALANSGVLTVDGGSGFSVTGALTGSGQTAVLGSSTLTADAIYQDALDIGAGSTVVIRPLSGEPLMPVPEPGSFVLLNLAAIGFIIHVWRKKS